MKRTLFLASCLAAFAVAVPALKADDKVDFEKQVFPILKTHCLKCHSKEHEEKGRMKKPKGGLTLDSVAGIKKGGKEDKDKCLVPGKAADSTIYVATTLKRDDDKAMPPEDKGDPLNDQEKATLKKWIDEGANFGSWTEAK